MITNFNTIKKGNTMPFTTCRCCCMVKKNAQIGLSEEIVITIAH